MSIRKRNSKKAKNGYTYQVYFNYKDKYNLNQQYIKGGFLTKKEAEIHELEMKKQFSDGFIKKKGVFSLNDIFDKYISNDPHTEKSTKIMRKNTYKKHFRNSFLGKMNIESIDYEIAQEFFNSKANVLSKGSCKNLLTILNSVLTYAYNHNFIARKPYDKIKINGYKIKKEKKTTTSDIFQMVIDSLKDKSNAKYSLRYKSYAIALYIGYYTGLRISEVFALEKKDIDFERRTIDVNKSAFYNAETKKMEIKDTKTEESENIVPLSSELMSILIKWFEEVPEAQYIVCDNDLNILSTNTLKQYLYRLGARKQIHISFHMLRHTFATELWKKDIDPKIAQRLLRHKNYNTTADVYTNLDNNDLTGVTDKLYN